MNEFWLPTSIGPVREHFSNVHDGWIMSPGMPDWAAYRQSVMDELMRHSMAKRPKPKPKPKTRKPAPKPKPKRSKPMADSDQTYRKPAVREVAKPKPAAKVAAKVEAKADDNPWHPVTDPAPEGKVLEIDGYDVDPELAVKTGGVWRSHVEGDKTKPVATQAPVTTVGPRRWRLRTAPKA